MDTDLRTLLLLVDHPDHDAARRWFTVLAESRVDASGEPVADWAELGRQLRDRAGSFPSDTVDTFLRQADRELEQPLSTLDRLLAELDPDRAAAEYDQERDASAPGAPDAPGASGEPDWAGFAAFLGRNDHGWQQSWPEGRDWLLHQGRQEGFTVEVESFEQYAASGPLVDVLRAYGVEATPTPEAIEAPTPEQAAADALDLGRRARAALVEQVPGLSISDEQLTAVLDRELRATS